MSIAGAAAVAAATPAQAQQLRQPVLGYLSSRSREEATGHTAAFLQGLEAAGWVVGRDVLIEYRWADGNYDRLAALAAELVGRGVTAIAAVGGLPSAQAARSAASAIPVIFLIGDDPVQVGLVPSLNRPGGNITGVTLIATGLAGKRLEILNDMVPGSGPAAVLINPSAANADVYTEEVQSTARSIGRRLVVAKASRSAQFAVAFELLSSEGVRALVVQNEPFFDSRREEIVHLASQYAVPTIYHIREFPQIGGLVSYGPSLAHAYYQTGDYSGRVLKGAVPSGLPVVQPTTFELVINAKVAQALKLSIPTSLLARADEVIE